MSDVASAADCGEASASAGPAKMSAKQQKLFELRMRMVWPLPALETSAQGWDRSVMCMVTGQGCHWQNEGRKMNHMEVAAEKRRATDPEGEAKRQRELADQRAEKKRKSVSHFDCSLITG